MKNIRNFTAIIEKDDNGYVALCPELDIASQIQKENQQQRYHSTRTQLYRKLKN